MNYLIKNIHIPISLMAFDLWISWLLTRTGLFCRDKGYKFFENKIEGYVKFLAEIVDVGSQFKNTCIYRGPFSCFMVAGGSFSL